MNPEGVERPHDVRQSPTVTTDDLETIEEARRAIASILDQHPHVKRLVENVDVISLAHKKHATKPCGNCERGKQHFVGRNVLPDGRLGLGGLFVFDHCGCCNTSQLS